MQAIVVDNLSKVFRAFDGRDKHAVRDLTFSVGVGQIYGLLGPNGAGKTTTLRMLSGLMSPTSGIAVLNGYNVAESPQDVKRSIGFLTANTGLYLRLSPRDVLKYFGELHDLSGTRAASRAEELIAWLKMEEFADLRCGALSTGQKQ